MSVQRTAILHEINDVIDTYLRVEDIGTSPHYKHRKSWQRICGGSAVDWTGLVSALASRIERNWNGKPSSGRENWRFEKQLKMDPENKKEKRIEKVIARWAGWANQIPTCSGVNPGGNGKRSVD